MKETSVARKRGREQGESAATDTAVAEPPVPQADERYEVIPLDLIRESKTNPRRTFRELEELAASIAKLGVCQPVRVRPLPEARDGSVELVCGARRLRASKMAGRTDIPCIVQALTDDQVLEIQITENNQRDGVHPLEECDGYQAMATRGYSVKDIAQKIGRAEPYVYERLSLARLIQGWQELFLADKIRLGHAALAARLEPEQQQSLLDWMNDEIEYGGLMSVRSMQDHVQQEYFLDLAQAAWKKDDETLVEEAGACLACSKRSGYSPALFPEMGKKDLCFDKGCFARKQAAHVARLEEKLLAKGTPFIHTVGGYVPESDLPAEHRTARRIYDHEILTPNEAKALPKEEVEIALIVAGNKAGRVVYVRANTRTVGGSGVNDESRELARKMREQARLREATQNAVLDAILASVNRVPDLADLAFLAEYAFDRVYHEGKVMLCRRRGWTKPDGYKGLGFDWQEDAARAGIHQLDEVQLHRFLLECYLVPAISGHNEKLPEDLLSAAKVWDVDVKAVTERIRQEAKEKAAAKKAKAGWTQSEG